MRPRRAHFDLVEHADVLTFPRLFETKKGTIELLPKVLEHAIGRRARMMKTMLKLPGMRGAFQTLHVASNRQGGWRVEARKLFMVAGDFVVPGSYTRPIPVPPEVIPAADFRLERHPNPRRIDVLDAVARACRYPSFLLRGDPEAAVAALRARSKLRLAEAYGCFRNKAARERAARG